MSFYWLNLLTGLKDAMLSIPQHISHQQLFTGGAGCTGINHFVPDTFSVTLLNNLPQQCLTVAFSLFGPSKYLMSLISWNTVSLWSRLSQSATISFLLHALLLLHYPMSLLLLLTATHVGSFVLETVERNGKNG